MSKKDYEAFAAMFNHYLHSEDNTEWNAGFTAAQRYMAMQMADHFAAGNPRFDRARFLKACGF